MNIKKIEAILKLIGTFSLEIDCTIIECVSVEEITEDPNHVILYLMWEEEWDELQYNLTEQQLSDAQLTDDGCLFIKNGEDELTLKFIERVHHKVTPQELEGVKDEENS